MSKSKDPMIKKKWSRAEYFAHNRNKLEDTCLKGKLVALARLEYDLKCKRELEIEQLRGIFRPMRQTTGYSKESEFLHLQSRRKSRSAPPARSVPLVTTEDNRPLTTLGIKFRDDFAGSPNSARKRRSKKPQGPDRNVSFKANSDLAKGGATPEPEMVKDAVEPHVAALEAMNLEWNKSQSRRGSAISKASRDRLKPKEREVKAVDIQNTGGGFNFEVFKEVDAEDDDGDNADSTSLAASSNSISKTSSSSKAESTAGQTSAVAKMREVLASHGIDLEELGEAGNTADGLKEVMQKIIDYNEEEDTPPVTINLPSQGNLPEENNTEGMTGVKTSFDDTDANSNLGFENESHQTAFNCDTEGSITTDRQLPYCTLSDLPDGNFGEDMLSTMTKQDAPPNTRENTDIMPGFAKIAFEENSIPKNDATANGNRESESDPPVLSDTIDMSDPEHRPLSMYAISMNTFKLSYDSGRSKRMMIRPLAKPKRMEEEELAISLLNRNLSSALKNSKQRRAQEVKAAEVNQASTPSPNEHDACSNEKWAEAPVKSSRAKSCRGIPRPPSPPPIPLVKYIRAIESRMETDHIVTRVENLRVPFSRRRIQRDREKMMLQYKTQGPDAEKERANMYHVIDRIKVFLDNLPPIDTKKQ